MDAPGMSITNSLETKRTLFPGECGRDDLGTMAGQVKAGWKHNTLCKDVIQEAVTESNDSWFVTPQAVLVGDQVLEGPVIQLDEDGCNLDYMHVFWVDEESEVVTEEVKHEQSVRQMTKRERDRQKKRAMRANPEYREKETEKARLRMKMRRQDPEYREKERRRDRDRRRMARLKSCI